MPKLLIPVDGDVPEVAPVNSQVSFVMKQLSPIVGFMVTMLALQRPASTSCIVFCGQVVVGFVIVKFAL